MKKVVFASNGECIALYDEDGNYIYGQRHGDDVYHMLMKLAKHLGFEISYTSLPETDGEYTRTI